MAAPNLNDNNDATLPLDTNKMPTAEEVQKQLNNLNIGQIIGQLSANPEHINKMMTESKSQLSPDMLDMAKKMANNGQGQKLMRDMESRGFDPKVMRAQLLKQQALAKGMASAGKQEGKTQKVILITTSRQIRVREFVADKIAAGAKSLLGTENPIEISCSRLAVGPLKDANIKAWYNPKIIGKNRRSSRITGFSIGSELLIIAEDTDLTEADFLAAEDLLK